MATKLFNAYVCMDCEEIYAGGGHGARAAQCPACGSRAGFPLRRWVKPSEDPLMAAGMPAEPAPDPRCGGINLLTWAGVA